MSHRAISHALWTALPTAALIAAGLVASPPAAAKWPPAEPCVSNGRTLKQQYGYSVAVLTPACSQLPVGEAWAVSIPWTMANSYEQKPPGFETVYATPLDNFRAALQSIEYVVDAGSAYQTNHAFPGDNKIWTGQLPSAPGVQAINTVGLGSLAPLPVGSHTVDVSWNLRAPHCDGFTADQGTSCLPQGETVVKHIAFTVVDPHAAGSQS
ncbi:hypothetical protein [Mycobacterium sp. 1274761.0]|uniref:hypothetical protein n=1 Tax=Mycobacterium sp. 1274761.0 TaxID=1834077 RepID=UPI0007FC03FB|nr:hypothetical protein [Mycobacterium sp. 1274761.0]OBK74202.1 hypothetical protein A5651_11345 [Mycobacterium sp. 1274761.0]